MLSSKETPTPLLLPGQWDSKAIQKYGAAYRSLSELTLLPGSSLNCLISDFPSAPGISCGCCWLLHFPHQAALHAMFMLLTFRRALRTPILPTSSQSSGSPGVFFLSPSSWNSYCRHVLTSTYQSGFYSPFLAEVQHIVFSKFILQLLRDLCSHVAYLPLASFVPCGQSTQWCHGHQDTTSMPLVSAWGWDDHSPSTWPQGVYLALEIRT